MPNIYQAGQKVYMFFFHKIKTPFLFSAITLLIWMFWVCWLSPKWYNVNCSQLMSWFHCYQFQPVYQIMEHHPARSFRHETFKPLLTHSISHSTFPYTAQIFFVRVSIVFTFLEIIKHNIQKCCIFPSIFGIKMASQKLTSFDKLFF